MAANDELRVRNGEIRIISRKRRRALKRMGRGMETRWSNSIGAYVREVKRNG